MHKVEYYACKQVKITSLRPLPILNHALLVARDGAVRLSTWDMESEPRVSEARARTDDVIVTGVPMYCKAENRPNGYRSKPHVITTHPFLDWLKVMAECDKSEQLFLSFDPMTQTLTIRTTTSRTEFKCLDAGEFPARMYPPA